MTSISRLFQDFGHKCTQLNKFQELKEKHAHYLGKMQTLQGKIAEVDKKLNGLKFTIIKDMDLLPDEVKRVDEGDAEQLNESIREEADYVASQRVEVSRLFIILTEKMMPWKFPVKFTLFFKTQTDLSIL